VRSGCSTDNRVQNYLQDQALGLTLIPLSNLLVALDNKLNINKKSVTTKEPTGLTSVTEPVLAKLDDTKSGSTKPIAA
jgi:hypothetical protein